MAHVVAHASVDVIPAHRLRRFLDHLLRILEDKVKHVQIHLLLDRVEVEVSLLAHGLVAVRIHDDREVLVDEADREAISVFLLASVQEVDGVVVEVGRASPDPTTLHNIRLSGSSANATHILSVHDRG